MACLLRFLSNRLITSLYFFPIAIRLALALSEALRLAHQVHCLAVNPVHHQLHLSARLQTQQHRHSHY